MPKLVVLDGNSLLYRGFFAMRALTTSERVPTNAVYSFVLMLLTILEREQPDAIFAAFDPPVATFRHAEMPTYKAGRQKMPDDLKPQRLPAREMCAAFRVPVVEVNGYEADDVCGTFAEIGKLRGFDVLIVTGDGDALQLVDDGSPLEGRGQVQTMITVKGVTDTVTYDEKTVKARYGIGPSQIPDFKGLKGDSSDNLSGVPGIGDKGASKLLQEWGSLDNLLFHVDELPDKLKDTLIKHTDDALLCRRLATIVRDVPLPEWVNLTADYQTVGPDFAAVREMFERLEFRTLVKRLPNLEREQRAKTIAAGGTTPQASEARVPSTESDEISPPLLPAVEALRTGAKLGGPGGPSSPPELGAGGPSSPLKVEKPLLKVAEIAALLSQTEQSLGISLHVTFPPKVPPTLMNAELHGIALAVEQGTAYVPLTDLDDTLRDYLGDAARPKSVYDLKFVTGVLARNDIAFHGAAFDTLLAAYLLNAGRAGYPFADIAADALGVELLPDAENPQAGAMDEAAALSALPGVLRPRLERDNLMDILETMEMPLAPVLAGMEQVGVSIDVGLLQTVSGRMAAQIGTLEGEIYALSGGEPFSIGSTKQLQEVLFDKLKLPAGKKTKTGYSTGADILEDLTAKGHEIAGKIITWRELSKLKSTYADALPALVNSMTGKVHTSLNQTVASTGRLSSSNPNLQNIPVRTEVGREIRKAFVAGAGHVLVSADYSQIELRLFAHITKDPNLVAAFISGRDIHAQTARRIFEVSEDGEVTRDQRRQAKTINFAVVYGASAFRVANELGIGQARAAELIKAYLELYPGVRAYLEDVLVGAREKGYVQTLLGRRRYVPDVNSRVYQFRQAAEREAANMPVQGTSADVIKLAMLRVDMELRKTGLSAKMVLQVHDELLFECPVAEVRPLAALVKREMQAAFAIDVPLVAEVKTGLNWWEVTPVADEDMDHAAA